MKFLLLLFPFFAVAQNTVWQVQVLPLEIDMPGLHTYSMGQANGKWLFVGGRRDGIHGVQPSQSYDAANRNSKVFVLDLVTGAVSSYDLPNFWPTQLLDQLSAASQQHYQIGDTLYIVGGYGYSATTNTKITHPIITAIPVSDWVAHQTNGPALSMPAWTVDERLAVCGGSMQVLDQKFYLVGGHRFDGNYNGTGQPTFIQSYTDQVRRFGVQTNQDGAVLQVIAFDTLLTHAQHLHRRDYNLVPQIFPDNSLGMTVFSGVFQPENNLPFLYPVDINADGFIPRTEFVQYLSNYHTATVPLWDSLTSTMHTLFLGGMSRYHYQNGTMLDDTLIPFVSTISRVSRDATGQLTEILLPDTMPGYLGTGAAFLPLQGLTTQATEQILRFDALNTTDGQLLGHIVGGMKSNYGNPYSSNDIYATEASSTVYEVRLKLVPAVNNAEIELAGKNIIAVQIAPNPILSRTLQYSVSSPQTGTLTWLVQDMQGKIFDRGEQHIQVGAHNYSVELPTLPTGSYSFTTHLNGYWFTSTQFVAW